MRPLPQEVDVAHTLSDAVRALAGRCDGARTDDGRGFNGRDADFGHSLAERPWDRWTERQCSAAHRMLRTYRKQLAGLGISYDELIQAPRDFSADQSRPWDRSATAAQRAQPQPPEDPAPSAEGSAAVRFLGPSGPIAATLPGYQARAPQLRLSAAIEAALANSTHLVAEAGTGTGKSFAYAIPAAQSNKQTLISTADKSLQDQLSGKDLPRLAELFEREGKQLTFAVLKGRSNYLCIERFKELSERLDGSLDNSFAFRSEGDAEAWAKLSTWETEDGDLDQLSFTLPVSLRGEVTVSSDECTGQRCPSYESCWAQRAKARAATANLVVVNHALLVRDMAISHATDGHATILPDAGQVIIDEAHHLESVAIDQLGIQIGRGTLPRLARRLARLTVEHPSCGLAKQGQAEGSHQTRIAGEWAERMAAAQEAFDRALAEIGDRLDSAGKSSLLLGDETALVEVGDQLHDLWSTLATRVPAWLSGDEADTAKWRKFNENLLNVAKGLQSVGTAAEDLSVARYVEREARSDGADRITLYRKSVDVSEALREMLWASKSSVIACSATLAVDGQMAEWRERVGCDEADEMIAESPFPFARNALLYLPADGQRFDPRSSRDGSVDYFDALAAEIEQLLLASGGRAFVLFSSGRALREVHGRIGSRLRWTVLLQGEAPRRELVRRFREDGNAVLFGLKSFWEGVDVAGEALSLVIIDKLPFAPPDEPVHEVRSRFVNAKYQDSWAWFSHLALPDAITALKQGFGRLIRTDTDRGVVAILDGRVTTKSYGTRIVRSLPPASRVRDLEAVRRFYRQ